MFLQEKEYIQLFRGGEKLMTAGLCKMIIWDQKIKVDYYMDHLPIPNETNGICHLLYLVRNGQEEQNLVQRRLDFPLIFLKSKFHYAFQTHENAENKIVKIENCYIELGGEHTLQLHGKRPQVKTDAQPGVRSGASPDVKLGMKAEKQFDMGTDTSSDVKSGMKAEKRSGVGLGASSDVKSSIKTEKQSDMGTDALPDEKSGMKAEKRFGVGLGAASDVKSSIKTEKQFGMGTDTLPDVKSGMRVEKQSDMRSGASSDAESERMAGGQSGRQSNKQFGMQSDRQKENTSAVKNVKEILETYPVRRLDDLKELLTMGDNFVEYYYNSFLLHGFYQYRHVLLGKDFLGVPGYFYEREAIAAKMMGFPYFIEAENVDYCCMGKGNRTDGPVEGSYGYFIRSTEAS